MTTPKKHFTRLATLAAVAALALGACSSAGTGTDSAVSVPADQSTTVTSTSTTAVTSQSDESSGQSLRQIGDTTAPPTAADAMAGNTNASKVGDDEWDAAGATTVTLSGTTASAQGQGVGVNGSTVTITAGGVYRLTGSLQGQVVVEAPEDAVVVLILADATITNSAGAAIDARTADDLVICLEGSSSVSDASTYTADAAANAAIHADMDLTVTGQGSLTVKGNGADGITSTDDLWISSGTLTVTAADDGLRGKDSLTVAGGTVNVTAGGDGLKSDEGESAGEDTTKGYVNVTGGTVKVTAQGDAVAAATDVILTGGSLDLSAGGGASAGAPSDSSSSAKGLKAGTYVIVEGATVKVDAADDAIHSDGALRLSKGTITAASGDDGVHAEVAAVLDGADVTVSQSVEALEAGLITVSAGTVSLTASDDGINGSGSTTVEAGLAAADTTSTQATQGGPGGGPGGGGMDNTGESVTISGGTLTVNAGGDGLDSNGTLTITGGTTTVWGPTNDGNGALDSNGGITVTGGTLVAVGSAGMAETPATGGQGFVAATVGGSAGSTVTVTDASGAKITSFTAAKEFASVVVSTPKITNGSSYTVSVDGSSTQVTAGEGGHGGMGGPGGGRPGGPGRP
ncbi:carbohydrate-binding domain-containing protein [Schaalia sp. 19OD2882]|uniref:carbohydrate-binding domain-containing protein n=1 Tax=Schaalia sp. 19OD2882 TaxID=2794089 RepID=UPI001C1EABF9|nr:carbohydrate-binding domain-containing protein [Schaalia sp. 19OD2882]QWW19519.1 carbohydrate-binding domain-containing protein [Schaalia sp. 19OD2882]